MGLDLIVWIGWFAVLLLGAPIAISFLIAGFSGLLLLGGVDRALGTMSMMAYSSVASESLLVVPLFVLTGQIAFAAGISRDAYDMAYRWLGRFRGGLAMASIAASAAFAATTGSSAATAATIGKIAIPEMKRFGYKDYFACGACAAGGVLGIMIPPSIPFVIYGIITETSIGKLLISGIVPGLMSTVIYILGIAVLTRFRPDIAPAGERFPWRERFRYLGKSTGILVLFVIIIGGIFSGIFTASEAAAFGAFTALILALLRRASFRSIAEACSESARTSAMIFLLIVGSMTLKQYMAVSGSAGAIVETIGGLGVSPLVVLLLILLLYVVLGCLMDGISMMLITMPVVFPIITNLGYNPIWFGVIIVKMIEIGALTPPVGFNCYVIHGVAPDVSLEQIFKGTTAFILMEFVTLAALIAWPEIAIWLPNVLLR